MPPFGGARTIYFPHCNVKKTADLAGAEDGLFGRCTFTTSYVAEMTRHGSKLGKTRKSIREDSGDSCHGVTRTLG
jgi:hypothetical protein